MDDIKLEVRRHIDDVLERHMEEEDRRFGELQQEIKDAWMYADEFRADDELVIALATAMNKTEEDIQIVFELAQTL